MFVMFAFSLATALVPAVPAAPPPAEEVKVAAITASSTMPKWKDYTFDAENLIDGRVDTSWQPAKKDTIGVGEWVELDLGAPYEIDHIDIAQGLQKVDPKLGDLFCRNNRFAYAYLLFDDGTFSAYWADPSERVSNIGLFYRGEEMPGKEVRVVTRLIRLVVVSVHGPVDWKDLAIAEISVFGRPAVVPSLPTGTTLGSLPQPSPVQEAIAWDQPGAYPFKAAVLDFCAKQLALRKQMGCAGLTSAIVQGYSREGSFSALPPISVADRDQGKVTTRFKSNRAQVSLDFERDTNGRWSVKRITRVDAAGRPAPPTLDFSAEEDRKYQNECWEKLGKKRPVYSGPD
ncbi:MAG: discoidin domain-containing protein [Deltaproteobacteria bacterium]|nr:discoidin domain-containing protein [Deltaproteobacteria bacterium]